MSSLSQIVKNIIVLIIVNNFLTNLDFWHE